MSTAVLVTSAVPALESLGETKAENMRGEGVRRRKLRGNSKGIIILPLLQSWRSSNEAERERQPIRVLCGQRLSVR